METSSIYKIYNKLERPFLESSPKRRILLAVTVVLLLGSVLMFFTKSVVVKMLPFDNKNEFQVVIDMPEEQLWNELRQLLKKLHNIFRPSLKW